MAQFERLENFKPDLHFFHRICRQRYTQRVADSLREQVAKADGRFHRTGHRRPGLRDADMQRIIRLMGEQPVGIDRVMHVGRLERHFHIGKAHVFQRVHRIERRFGERFGGRPAIFVEQGALKRSAVHTDPQRDAACIHRLDDLFDLPPRADVAGVDADAINDFCGFQGQAMIEVNVGDQAERSWPP